MGLFFTKGKDKKRKAIAFVDFEHWYISLDKLHRQKPDIQAWRDELVEEYQVDAIYFFGDFSNASLRAEIEKIRHVTNLIIETKNASAYHKKDHTDFIMLDNIYQTAISRTDVDTFIIFSGDGHFSSVAAFLRNKRDKEVGVYGVRDAVSNQLKSVATWTRELPEASNRLSGFYYPVLKNLKHVESKSGTSYPAFKTTAEYVAKYYELNVQDVKDAMQEMLSKGYLYQEEVAVSGKTLRVLRANWKLAEQDGIWQE